MAQFGDWRGIVKSFFFHKPIEVKILVGHEAPGFRPRVENEELYSRPRENEAEQDYRLKKYPVLDTVGRTF